MGKYQPALLGGLFIGVLSSLPIVRELNWCCCLWVVAGGLLTTYLMQQSQPAPVSTTDGAVQGLIAGLIGGVLASIATYVIFTLAGGSAVLQESIREALDQNPNLPPEARDMALRFASVAGVGLFFVNLVIFPVFSMAGSLLGLAFFRKKTPPAAPPPPPMTPQM